MQLLQVLRDEQPSPICRDILKAAGGHSCQAHLIQSPVGAQRQQIIVLSLQNLTCLMAKKKRQNILIHTRTAILSAMATKSADMLDYLRRRPILPGYGWAEQW